MHYGKSKLRKKIKFYKKDMVGEMSKEEEIPEGEPSLMKGVAKDAVDSRINLKKGIEFYRENSDMPKAKELLKNKRYRYLKSLKKLKAK